MKEPKDPGVKPGQSIDEHCPPVDFTAVPQSDGGCIIWTATQQSSGPTSPRTGTFDTVSAEDFGELARLVAELRAENDALKACNARASSNLAELQAALDAVTTQRDEQRAALQQEAEHWRRLAAYYATPRDAQGAELAELRAENERLSKLLSDTLERADKLAESAEQHMAADVRYRVDREWWAALCGDEAVAPAPQAVAAYVLKQLPLSTLIPRALQFAEHMKLSAELEIQHIEAVKRTLER